VVFAAVQTALALFTAWGVMIELAVTGMFAVS
jgi:hypothetical protein